MLSRCFVAVVVVVAAACQAHGFDVVVVVREIDSGKRTALVFAGGQERTLVFAEDARFLDEEGVKLSERISSPKLKDGTTVTLTVERKGNTATILAIRLSGRVPFSSRTNEPTQVSVGKSSSGLKPLTEMTAADRYKGEDGGLYGGGSNELPEALRAIAQKRTAKIVPRDPQGRPDTDGKIGLVSISMSNATQEYSRFKQIADADSEKSSLVTIVDCAQGGQTMARWADPDASCWTEADRRLQAASLSHEQVQVAWVKLANARPIGEIEVHGHQLQRDTQLVLANLHSRFPNLQIAYLGSRIYGGWADGRLNPEPYAYEGGFVARWVIQSQLKDDYDWDSAPLALWGPYFWADGLTPRQSDKLVWQRRDVVSDGTHPSDSGRQKVAIQLLNFFKTDDNARTWFTRH